MCHEGQAVNCGPCLAYLRSLSRLFPHGLHTTGGITYLRSLILHSNAAYQCTKQCHTCLPRFFQACTKQLSLKFLEVLCNLSNSREHLGARCITKSNNSNNNNNNNSKAVKAQGCCDFQQAVVLFWNSLLQCWETSLTRQLQIQRHLRGQVTQRRAFYSQIVGMNPACVDSSKGAYKLKTLQYTKPGFAPFHKSGFSSLDFLCICYDLTLRAVIRSAKERAEGEAPSVRVPPLTPVARGAAAALWESSALLFLPLLHLQIAARIQFCIRITWKLLMYALDMTAREQVGHAVKGFISKHWQKK